MVKIRVLATIGVFELGWSLRMYRAENHLLRHVWRSALFAVVGSFSAANNLSTVVGTLVVWLVVHMTGWTQPNDMLNQMVWQVSAAFIIVVVAKFLWALFCLDLVYARLKESARIMSTSLIMIILGVLGGALSLVVLTLGISGLFAKSVQSPVTESRSEPSIITKRVWLKLRSDQFDAISSRFLINIKNEMEDALFARVPPEAKSPINMRSKLLTDEDKAKTILMPKTDLNFIIAPFSLQNEFSLEDPVPG